MSYDRRLLEDGVSFRLLETGGGFRLLETSAGGVVVPDVQGRAFADASALLGAASLTVGGVTQVYNAGVTAGLVISELPPAGTTVAPGSAVNLVLSLGAQIIFVVVPNVVGMTPANAEIALHAAGLAAGSITGEKNATVRPGLISSESPAAGTNVLPGATVNLGLSVLVIPFDVDRTVISQYANSPTILALLHSMNEYIDPSVNLQEFYDNVWNVDTAQGFGLDIWGKIVGVSRLLKIPSNSQTFGFSNADIPPDWAPFNQGTFYIGANAGQSFLLPDDAYRTLILVKALANIVATSAPSLNKLLQNLFPGRGRSYVLDNGGMSMTFYFEFTLTTTEYAILTQSGVLPHPAAVRFNVVINDAGTFGFEEMGGTIEPFDQGTFYQPPGS